MSTSYAAHHDASELHVQDERAPSPPRTTPLQELLYSPPIPQNTPADELIATLADISTFPAEMRDVGRCVGRVRCEFTLEEQKHAQALWESKKGAFSVGTVAR